MCDSAQVTEADVDIYEDNVQFVKCDQCLIIEANMD